MGWSPGGRDDDRGISHMLILLWLKSQSELLEQWHAAIACSSMSPADGVCAQAGAKLGRTGAGFVAATLIAILPRLHLEV
ncbi:hypothetical protein F0562_025337 [Nyssa sinensis]|uniref:Uncharacterized protein n=1 Tax=Nyssa sinensis TaxID=561372 RepID=A0A5J5BE22_9ASTE|nr:hypothetical protein F0562_025337 [Nyssa sinensis]